MHRVPSACGPLPSQSGSLPHGPCPGHKSLENTSEGMEQMREGFLDLSKVGWARVVCGSLLPTPGPQRGSAERGLEEVETRWALPHLRRSAPHFQNSQICRFGGPGTVTTKSSSAPAGSRTCWKEPGEPARRGPSRGKPLAIQGPDDQIGLVTHLHTMPRGTNGPYRHCGAGGGLVCFCIVLF